MACHLRLVFFILVLLASPWAARHARAAGMAYDENWGVLAPTQELEHMPESDRASYAVAASLVDFLLTQGDKATLLKFAAEGKAKGYAAALETHYGVRSLDALEQAWRAYVAGSLTDATTTAARGR